MLSIYFGDMPEAIYNTSVYFDNSYQDDWITDDLTVKMIISYEVTADVEEYLDHNINIYPNPTSGLVNIISEGEQAVTIFNMVGQRVFEGRCEGELQIDMKRFGAGVYAVKVGNETQRVVVK